MIPMGDWHEYLIKRLADPEKARSYLDVALEEYQTDGDLHFLLLGLRNVVEAHGGVPTLAKRIGITPEELSEILSGEAALRFDTFISILAALGYRLSIAPLAQTESTDEALTEIVDSLFVEHDKTEAADAEVKSRGSLVS